MMTVRMQSDGKGCCTYRASELQGFMLKIAIA